jgi:hypothetical protein
MLAIDVPLTSELTEALHDARNRSLLAMERVEDADIRKRVASFRHAAAQWAAANTRVQQQTFEEQCEQEYEPLIETLGKVIREHS